MDLLHKFVLKLGGGQLPSRLLKVLPKAQAALDDMNLRGRVLEEARQRLRLRLQRFQCCRNALTEVGADSQAEEEVEEEEDAVDQKDTESKQDANKLQSWKGDKVRNARNAGIGRKDAAIVEAVSSEDVEEAVDFYGYDGLCHDWPCDREAGEASKAVPDAQPVAVVVEDAEQCANQASPQFFKKIDEWANMVNREKLACLKQLQLASACS